MSKNAGGVSSPGHHLLNKVKQEGKRDMKDFENDLIYYPNPDPIEEPRFILNSVEELEKSTKYSVICNGTERVVYHTDSFDYVIVVDDEAYDLEISIHTPFEKLAIRPTSFGIVPSVTGETVQIHLDEPKKFTVETEDRKSVV